MARKKTASKPDFKVPGATGNGQAEKTVADDAPKASTNTAEPRQEEAILFDLELVHVPEERCGRRIRIDRMMSVQAARGGGRLRESFRRNMPDEKMENGRYIDGNYTGQSVQRLLERLSDPRIRRVIFLSE